MKLLVLDGNSIFNRAFYGIKLLTTKDGLFTNAIYGFLTMLQKIKEDTVPDAIAIAFDMRAPTFRHKAYSGYKAQRKGMPPELAQQFPILKELLTLLGYKIVECEGFEADDILGTLAQQCQSNGNECVIATGDRDSLQLVSPLVSVRLMATKMGRPEVTMYDEEKIKEIYGVTPKQLIDIKAIQGDTSDNIPGVKGIGEKGAKELIGKFGSLDYIYNNIETIDIKDGMRKKLITDKDNAYMSRMLGEINTEAPVATEITDYIPQPCQNEEAVRLMAKLEFFSLIEKMGLRNTVEANTSQKEELAEFATEFLSDTKQLTETLISNKKAVFLADIQNGEINTLAFAFSDHIAVVNNQLCTKEFLKAIFENNTIEKQSHNLKPVFAVLDKENILPQNMDFDTVLAAYLLNPAASGYDVLRLAEEYAVNVPPIALTDDQNLNLLLKECTALLFVIEKLHAKILENNQEKLLREIEIPLAQVLASMENIGFRVDAKGIKDYGAVLEDRLKSIEQLIYNEVGYEFNINSPKQLGAALFEKLMLPVGKKTKSGYSTSADVLEGLKGHHPVVGAVLEYRTLSKLKSTYCDGLLKVIAADDRIHSNFNQTETRTGRISSTEPNLQNIPVRTEMGRELRRFFCARDGYVLIDADYSQIELRVLADISCDKTMIDAFKDRKDIHTITASQVFNMPEAMVTPQMRSSAKAVNFGIVYGIGAFSLAKDIGVTRKEADNYIKAYLSHYAGIDEYMKNVVEKAKKDGYVETMFNRRRYLPELTSSNFNTRSFGERVARNMPIQGTAADIIKIAMIRVYNKLKSENMTARLILQVHDELIVEAPQNEAMRVAMLLQEEMENAVQLRVPLVAEAAIGETWYDAKA